ncbi:hypothetical protein V7201_04135 [Bacillus sp. JJ1122]|uniref:hypothetical protein n=1 Tax=Bacillus sp. JJ1122 TaxID=3122951 RepID=UPI002FFEAD45
MSIQQYYQQAANIRLNGSIVSAGMLSIILTVSLLLSWDIPFLVVAVPFLSVCFLQYNSYLLYRNRSEESRESISLYDEKNLLSQNHLMIAFAPAPCIRLLFFTPDGMLAGELKEIKIKQWRWIIPFFIDKRMSKQLGIYDAHGRQIGRLLSDPKKTKLVNEKGEIEGFFYPKKKSSTAIVEGGKKLKLEGANSDLFFINAYGMEAFKLQKGWMPLEWSHFFIDANTPVLTFDYSLTTSERLAVFAAVAHYYKYYNH